MAVEARHLNLFPPQLIQDRELMNAITQGNGAAAAYNAQQMRFLGIPSAEALPENQFYHQAAAVCEAKTSVNTDSGLTYNISAPRKRSRDAFNQFHAVQNFAALPQQQKSSSLNQLPTLAGDDIMPQIHQYQFEIDALISQHTKKIRLELEERQKQQARLLAAAIGEGVMKKLKEKDEQIQRMGKLNLVLQERVKSLYVENQLWRDLAQTNEATANSLRSNLEQVLQQVGGEDGGVVAVEDDVESCCGSSDGGEAQDKDEGSSSCYGDRRCRLCGERESCVLLLPCRHLCLCSGCGSGSQQLQSCPVCNSSMTATLHVNMS
ncbi:LOW QUALITY PROTEIN: BOI-related E3 ubiquitin-protein ligase 1-like [Salvia miltiorrhiza]|uniref:LOW QUALITY PROTEIN: BOI-related E3 ubiquitin-protein ligase 1-like n=1 Tax=Salvia miltiorrhiza TaxID=226208 RepID=UPI0025ABCC91|nr:LOW QUALITY PROTEIN: BOI-related E3 ubiquitin-protein ligase 1-like [Salvia miltiorrhiza]